MTRTHVLRKFLDGLLGEPIPPADTAPPQLAGLAKHLSPEARKVVAELVVLERARIDAAVEADPNVRRRRDAVARALRTCELAEQSRAATSRLPHVMTAVGFAPDDIDDRLTDADQCAHFASESLAKCVARRDTVIATARTTATAATLTRWEAELSRLLASIGTIAETAEHLSEVHAELWSVAMQLCVCDAVRSALRAA